MDAGRLKDVLINLFGDKYSKDEKLEALVWGEKNTDVYWPLMKEVRPEYYNEDGFSNCPVMGFTLLQDFKDNFESTKYRLTKEEINKIKPDGTTYS